MRVKAVSLHFPFHCSQGPTELQEAECDGHGQRREKVSVILWVGRKEWSGGFMRLTMNWTLIDRVGVRKGGEACNCDGSRDRKGPMNGAQGRF